MVPQTVFDFAFSRPRPDKIKANGAVGVVRYLCRDTSKRITRAEYLRYIDRGLAVALVYEDGAEDILLGPSAGREMAAVAAECLAEINGVPIDRPVYLAADFNLNTSGQCAAGFATLAAFADTLGRPRAAYGPYPFLDYCQQRGVEYLWACGASSWNVGPRPRLSLQQLAAGRLVNQCAVDVDIAIATDWGQCAVLEH